MQTVSLPLRTAMFSTLTSGAGVVFSTQKVGVFEEVVQETSTNKKARFTVGTDTIEAYIILMNQTENDISPKCMRSDQASIQMQVTTVFPANRGGSKTAELIANAALAILFPVTDLETGLTLPAPFKIWKSTKEGSRNLNYDTQTQRVWIHQIILTCNISQN